jgi:C4-dicarboxylate-specific signal transduction histidine kinase
VRSGRRRPLSLRGTCGTAGAALSRPSSDTGPGIPAENQARVLEPFFTTKSEGQGTGLGLALTRGIVDGHGGTIRVASRPGEGAAFHIELPIGALETVENGASLSRSWRSARTTS